jgi:hypothetical protein
MKKFTLLIATIALVSFLFITPTLSQSETTAPKITVNPKSVNFGSIAVGSVSAPKPITIKNAGVSGLVINSITITGTNASEFSQTNDCNTGIPTGSTCTIGVTFAPGLPFSKKSAIMSILSNDPKKPTINVKLSGQAPQPKITVSPKSVNFGSEPVGNTPAPKIVTIKNTGISDLTISTITITGTNENEFSQTNDCSIVTNGNLCAITVTFNPGSVSSKNAAISIASNDPKKPTVNVKLTGKATEGSVNNQSPIVSSLNPNKGSQGQTLDVIITGAHFINATSVNFGADIKVNSFTVESSTQITANITISLSAATGLRNVNVTTPIGTGTGTGLLFEVQAFLPDVTFSFIDDAIVPSGVFGEVDNATRQFRVVGIANPNTSRYVFFNSNQIPIADMKTAVFEADISLPTGLRAGEQGSSDPCGDQSETSMGTPVLFRIYFSNNSAVEVSMQTGLNLEQIINGSQPQDEISLNGGLARAGTRISKWTGGPASFDPLGLIQAASVGAQFHVRLSIDLEQNKIMAEIEPKPAFEGNFQPIPPGSELGIVSPFVAVTNLIDYTKDPWFDGTLFFGIAVRTNGNTEFDAPLAPGGTLRYIDREFSNVQVSFNKPVEFPPIPPLELPSDNFDDGTIAAFWDLFPMTGLF